MKCIKIIVAGKVQGVFFRHNTRLKAIKLGLVGYVKNLADGNVEVIIQGTDWNIKELIEFIRSNPGNSRVLDVRMEEMKIHEFMDFRIK